MKYIAKPVEVHAYKVAGVPLVRDDDGGIQLLLENGTRVTATPEMCARMTPRVGDYWVIQSDGYIYLNPKEVFERKYEPAGAAAV